METDVNRLFQMLIEKKSEQEQALDDLKKMSLCFCQLTALFQSKFYFHRLYLIDLLRFCPKCKGRTNEIIFSLITEDIYRVGKKALMNLTYEGDLFRLYNVLIDKSTFPFLIYQFLRRKQISKKLLYKFIHIGFWKVDFLLAKNIKAIFQWDSSAGNEIFRFLLIKCNIYKSEKIKPVEDGEELFNELLIGMENFYEEKVIFNFVKDAYKKFTKDIDGKLFSLLINLYKNKQRKEIVENLLIDLFQLVMIDDNLPLKFDIIKLLNILNEPVFTDLIPEFLSNSIRLEPQELGSLQEIAFKNSLHLCKIPISTWTDRLKLLRTISHIVVENHTLFTKYLKNIFFSFFKDRVAKIRQLSDETFIAIIRNSKEEVIECCYEDIVHILNGSRERERLSIVHSIIEIFRRHRSNKKFLNLFKLIIKDRSEAVQLKVAVYLKLLNDPGLNSITLTVDEQESIS